MDDRERALRRAAEIGLDYLAGLADRHVGRARRCGDHPRAAAGGASGRTDGPGRGHRGARRRGRSRRRRERRPALLRVRGRRAAAGIGGRGLADHGLGPERRRPRAVAGGRRGGGNRRRLDARAARPAARRERRPADRARGWATRSGWRRRATPCWRRRAGTSRRAGLYGAPEITVVIGEEAHATLLTALQYLGLGRDRVVRVPTDDQGQMEADAARTRHRRRRGAADRRRPGRQREHRRLRSGRRDRRRRSRVTRTPGSTSTAPSACGPPSRRG